MSEMEMSAQTEWHDWANVERSKLHTAVDDLAIAMKEKLEKKLRQGFSGGLDSCPPSELIRMAKEHLQRLEDGDPLQDVDVANFMVFLFAQRKGASR